MLSGCATNLSDVMLTIVDTSKLFNARIWNAQRLVETHELRLRHGEKASKDEWIAFGKVDGSVGDPVPPFQTFEYYQMSGDVFELVPEIDLGNRTGFSRFWRSLPKVRTPLSEEATTAWRMACRMVGSKVELIIPLMCHLLCLRNRVDGYEKLPPVIADIVARKALDDDWTMKGYYRLLLEYEDQGIGTFRIYDFLQAKDPKLDKTTSFEVRIAYSGLAEVGQELHRHMAAEARRLFNLTPFALLVTKGMKGEPLKLIKSFDRDMANTGESLDTQEKVLFVAYLKLDLAFRDGNSGFTLGALWDAARLTRRQAKISADNAESVGFWAVEMDHIRQSLIGGLDALSRKRKRKAIMTTAPEQKKSSLSEPPSKRLHIASGAIRKTSVLTPTSREPSSAGSDRADTPASSDGVLDALAQQQKPEIRGLIDTEKISDEHTVPSDSLSDGIVFQKEKETVLVVSKAPAHPVEVAVVDTTQELVADQSRMTIDPIMLTLQPNMSLVPDGDTEMLGVSIDSETVYFDALTEIAQPAVDTTTSCSRPEASVVESKVLLKKHIVFSHRMRERAVPWCVVAPAEIEEELIEVVTTRRAGIVTHPQRRTQVGVHHDLAPLLIGVLGLHGWWLYLLSLWMKLWRGTE